MHEYLTEWLPSIEAGVRPSTYASYKQHVESHLKPLLGSIPLQKLSPEAIGAAYGSPST